MIGSLSVACTMLVLGGEATGLEEIDTSAPVVEEAPAEEEKPEVVVPDVVVGEELPPPEEPETFPASALRQAIAVRAGAFLPSAGTDASYSATFIGGVSYELRRAESSFGVELGIDFAPLSSNDGATTDSVIFLRCDAVYDIKSFYALAGLQGVSEAPKDDYLGTLNGNFGGALDLGVGGRFGKFDARVVYSILLGSENVPGATSISFGYCF